MTEDAHSRWYCADADEQGFVSYEYIRREASRLDVDEFKQGFPVPALMVVYRGVEQAENEGMDPGQSGVQLLTMSVKGSAILRYLSRIAFVCKRPGNPYAHLISIGRSVNNDITIAVDSVSKVHGYVVIEDGQWHFTDHGSTNGSRINGRELEAGEKYPLKDRDVLQLGLEVMLEVMHPETLYHRAVS